MRDVNYTAIKENEPFANVVEQSCVILHLPEDAQEIIEAYQQIKQGNRSIKEYILDMEPAYCKESGIGLKITW